MGVFEMELDARSDKFMADIADTMMRIFGIEKQEAVSRMNERWEGQKLPAITFSITKMKNTGPGFCTIRKISIQVNGQISLLKFGGRRT